MIVPTTINDFVYYVNVLILKLEQNRIVTQERTVSLSFIVLSAWSLTRGSFQRYTKSIQFDLWAFIKIL